MRNKNLILVYDDLCPLCVLYTSWFVKIGLLPAEGRKLFSQLPTALLAKIDYEKSRNEIPLIDTQGNNVWYGIDSLLEILDQALPFVKKIGKIAPVNWFLRKVYKFISYNRKVIVAKKCGAGSIDCSPDFSVRYRILFMAISLIFNTALLLPIHTGLLLSLRSYQHDASELQIAHASLVVLNILLACSLSVRGAIDYLGQVNMLALISMLMLLPLLMLNRIGLASYEMNIVYLTISTCILIKEYYRRMQFLGIHNNHKVIIRMNFLSLAAFLGYLFVPF